MNRHCAIATGLLSSLLLLGSPSTPPVQAETEMEMPAAEDTLDTKFQQVDQPLSAKAAVTVGGLALIAAELWWFLGKRR
jgi:plastocyanin domain-containing protein